MRSAPLLLSCICAGVLVGEVSAAPPRAPSAAPPARLYLAALPAAITYVAWLPVEGQPDQVDLDLKVAVVLARDCGDEVAGVTPRPGASAAEPAFDVLLLRNALGECGDKPVRRNRRASIRVTIPRGASRSIAVGSIVLRAARDAGEGAVTINGGPPEGEVRGAARTEKPWVLIPVEVTTASVESARVDERGFTHVDLKVAAKMPACAALPEGAVGTGAVSAIDRFMPMARMPQDVVCGRSAVREFKLGVLLRSKRGAELRFSIGDQAIVAPCPPAPSPSVAPTPSVAPVPTDAASTTKP